jgi:hypothetical protein
VIDGKCCVWRTSTDAAGRDATSVRGGARFLVVLFATTRLGEGSQREGGRVRAS